MTIVKINEAGIDRNKFGQQFNKFPQKLLKLVRIKNHQVRKKIHYLDPRNYFCHEGIIQKIRSVLSWSYIILVLCFYSTLLFNCLIVLLSYCCGAIYRTLILRIDSLYVN